jgi:tetratricopeptide (TPR) repeat protein
VALAGCAERNESRAAAQPEPPPLPVEIDRLEPAIAERVRARHAELLAAPDDPYRWFVLGMTYEVNLLPGEAYEAYAGAIALAPDDPRWWYSTAHVAQGLGRPEEALCALQRSLELGPGYLPGYWWLGTWQLEAGDLDAARTTFERAVREDERHPAGWLGQARVAIYRDENERALACCDRALALVPGDPYALQLRATALRQAGRGDEVSGQLAPKWDVPPWPDARDDELRYHRAPTSLMVARRLALGADPEHGIALLAELADERPGDVRILNILGSAHAQAGNLAEARRAFERALEVEPENIGAHLNLATILSSQGDVDGAIEVLDRALVLQPDYALLHEREGLVWYGAGRFAEAEAALGRAWALAASSGEGSCCAAAAFLESSCTSASVCCSSASLPLSAESSRHFCDSTLSSCSICTCCVCAMSRSCSMSRSRVRSTPSVLITLGECLQEG